MIDWTYKNKPFTEAIEDAEGFVYHITFSNGKKYIGKKNFFHKITKPPLKGYKRKRKAIKESDWKTYCGSIKDEEFMTQLKEGLIKPIKREILHICKNKAELTYREVEYQFSFKVLEDTSYLNNCILGKFYRGKW